LVRLGIATGLIPAITCLSREMGAASPIQHSKREGYDTSASLYDDPTDAGFTVDKIIRAAGKSPVRW